MGRSGGGRVGDGGGGLNPLITISSEQPADVLRARADEKPRRENQRQLRKSAPLPKLLAQKQR